MNPTYVLSATRLSPGDLVEVKSPSEILATLDENGAVANLPFMPEMVEFCGRRFRVSQRLLKTCFYGSCSTMRKFRNDDVVLLENLRCSGVAHDGCQKSCMIFWREAWLRKVDAPNVTPIRPPESNPELLARLKTKSGPVTYFCQASELLKATDPLSRWGRLKICIADVREGNCSSFQMLRRVSIWLLWRSRRKLFGYFGSGKRKSTPVESLSLRSGEVIQIKPIESITPTLDNAARNRGLFFSPDMSFICGEKKRVVKRIDKIIIDGTGEMRRLRDTVFLEESYCGCPYVALGGCSRGEYAYWREIWLRRAA